MTFVESYYHKAKQTDEFIDAIEQYDDGRYTVMYNALTGYDIIMRRRPNVWWDSDHREHWREEWMPCITIMHPSTRLPRTYETCVDYWIGELNRTHMRNKSKTIQQEVKDMIEHNEKLSQIRDEAYRKKQALDYAKRWENNFASITVGDKPWENQTSQA